jgi:uncharacterized protein
MWLKGSRTAIPAVCVWIAAAAPSVTIAFTTTPTTTVAHPFFPAVVVVGSSPALKTTALAMSTATNSHKNEIKVISQPDDKFLEQKGVYSWDTWGCGVSTFPWTYDSAESCYVLKGKVTVTPTDGGPPATFGKGDFVTFPAGMSCTWDVTEAVQKHYMFH